jgi:glutathione S-transferase
MSPSLEVHLDPCTVNSRKLLAALTLLDTPYTLKKVDYFAGEHKSSEYKAINPCATVPCAVIDNSLVLTESNAIIAYAGDLAGDNPAYPADKKIRADINRWLFWETSVWFPSCYVYLIQNVVQPVLGNAPDDSVTKKEEPRWRELAGVLEQKLQKGDRKWLCGGEEPTVADLAVASSMHLWKREKFPIEGFPALRKWIGRVEGLECWVSTQGAVEKAFPEPK